MAALTMAIAGHAENDPVNVKMLLSDWLRLGAPDREGYYDKSSVYDTITLYALLTEDAIPQGLKGVLDILPFVDGVQFEIVTGRTVTDGSDVDKWSATADDTHTVDDPLEYTISLLEKARVKRLLINWDESDADDDLLIRRAHTGSIPVYDLVYGMTEITPDNPELESAPAPEPEPEQPKPKTRRTRRMAEELREEPEELPDTSPDVTEPQAQAPSGPEEPKQMTIATGEITIPANTLREIVTTLDRAALYLRAVDAQEAARHLKEVKENSPLATALGEHVKGLNMLLHPELNYSSVVAKQKSANPWGVATKVIWDDEKQEWKKAGRGRVRAGTRTGMMDIAGIVREDK